MLGQLPRDACDMDNPRGNCCLSNGQYAILHVLAVGLSVSLSHVTSLCVLKLLCGRIHSNCLSHHVAWLHGCGMAFPIHSWVFHAIKLLHTLYGLPLS